MPASGGNPHNSARNAVRRRRVQQRSRCSTTAMGADAERDACRAQCLVEECRECIGAFCSERSSGWRSAWQLCVCFAAASGHGVGQRASAARHHHRDVAWHVWCWMTVWSTVWRGLGVVGAEVVVCSLLSRFELDDVRFACAAPRALPLAFAPVRPSAGQHSIARSPKSADVAASAR
jgi:hypothetical protein